MPANNIISPGMNIAARQPQPRAYAPILTKALNSRGITICVTPPPRFPQPATVALAGPDDVRREHHRGVILRDDERKRQWLRSPAER